MLVGVGFALESNDLVDRENLGIDDLTRNEIVKAPASALSPWVKPRSCSRWIASENDSVRMSLPRLVLAARQNSTKNDTAPDGAM